MSKIAAWAEENRVTFGCAFVPWSKSRFATLSPEPFKQTLNWKIDLFLDERLALEALDWTEGSASCPSYKRGAAQPESARVVARECESGFECRYLSPTDQVSIIRPKKAILPNYDNFLIALGLDAEAATMDFESWAVDAKLNLDSRASEAIYKKARNIGQRLQGYLSHSKVDELIALSREAIR